MSIENAKTIRKKILLPLASTIALFLLIFVTFFEYLEDYLDRQDTAQTIESVNHNFEGALELEIQYYRTLAFFVAHNKTIRQLWAAENKQELLKVSEPIFKYLKETFHVTHFYFHRPNGVNYLRVHQPDRSGDLIDRHTLKQALKNKKFSAGVEFGVLGYLVLRTVMPVYHNNKLLGYLELGEEIEHLIDKISSALDLGLLLAIDNEFMEKKAPGYITPGTAEAFENFTIVFRSQNMHINGDIKDFVDQRDTDIIHAFLAGKPYLSSSMGFSDSLGNTFGKIIFIRDRTNHNNYVFYLFWVTIVSLVVLALILLAFYYIQTGSIKKDLIRSYHLMNAEIYQTLFDNTSDAILIIEDNVFIDCNRSTMDMLGYKYDEKPVLLNTHPSKLSPDNQPCGESSLTKAEKMIAMAYEKGSHRFEWDHQRKNGEVFPVEVVLTCIPVGEKNYLHTVWRDISERKKAEAEVDYRANYDSLTKLPNRQMFMDKLVEAMTASESTGIKHGLLFLDLDHFKSVNDTLGHHIGDKLLIEVSRRIMKNLREGDIAARLGGDEFVVLLHDLGTNRIKAREKAANLCQNYLKEFKDVFHVNQYELNVTTSIGYTLFLEEGETRDDILKHADIAMYNSKENGRNRITEYVPAMKDRIISRLMIEKDLKKAVDNNALDVHYQPILDRDLKVRKVEALVRWHHTEKGMVGPNLFIPVAEENGLIHKIGDFVLRKAIEDVMAVNKETGQGLELAVNISPMQFHNEDFMNDIKSIVDEYKLPKDFLTLELTENIFIENINIIVQRLSKLKQLGLKVALDDFGTGYSSLSYLKSLPIDQLKIDRAFMLDISSDLNSAKLVKTILSIANQFGLETVAEGIEHKSQIEFLQNEKCSFFQGYYYSRPMSYSDLLEHIFTKQYSHN